MDRRFEIRCSEEQLARWRAAVPGGVPFASWVRAALEAASVRPPRLESHAVMGDRVIDMHTREVVQVLPARPAFQPDFKKGGKR